MCFDLPEFSVLNRFLRNPCLHLVFDNQTDCETVYGNNKNVADIMAK